MSNPNPAKKKLKIIAAALLLLLLALVALLGCWIWYWPVRWQQDFQNGYLLRNQPLFRVAAVKPGNFNKLQLENVELGRSGHELLKTSRGILKFSVPENGNWKAPAFEALYLPECNLHLQSRNGKILINNHPLPDFLQELAALPSGPDGQAFKLIISGNWLNNQQITSAFELMITPDRAQNALLISGQWQSTGSADGSSGSYQAHIALNSNTISATFSGDLPLVFYQELLLRSNVPTKLAALLQNSQLKVQGKLTSSLKSLAINELQISGQALNPRLQWYRQKNIIAENFDFSLHKTPRTMTLQIPSMLLKTPSTMRLHNLQLTGSKNQQHLKFSAHGDLRLFGMNFFANQLNFNELNNQQDTPDKITGSWNLANDQWQLQGATGNKNSYRNLQLTSGSGVDSKLLLTPGKLIFNASGLAGRGRFQQEMDFTHLELHNPWGAFRAERGKFYAAAELGFAAQTANHTLDFNLNNVSADTPYGQIDLPDLAGELNLRNHRNLQREIYLISRGRAVNVVANDTTAELTQWQSTVNLESLPGNQQWRLSGLNFSSPQLQLAFSATDKKTVFEQININASGEVENSSIQNIILKGQARNVKHPDWTIQQPQLKLDYNKQRPANEAVNANFSCARLDWPENISGIRNVVNASCQFTAAIGKLPEKALLQAASLQFQRGVWNGKLLNSQWQIRQRSTPYQWDSDVKFAHLELKSQPDKFGSGSFSNGTLALQSQFDRKWNLSKLDILGELPQPTWRFEQLHTGAENMQTIWKFDRSSDPCLQGSVKMQNANLLGEYFSGITPALESEFAASSNQSVTGYIKFAPGTISSPQNELELRNAEFFLPFLAAAERPSTLKKGYLKARECRWMQQNEGALDCRLEHFMQLSDNLHKTFSHSIDFNGTLQAEKFASAAVSIQAKWQLPPEKPSLLCSFNMPRSPLQQPLTVNNYLNLPGSWAALKGLFSFSGQAEFRTGTPGMLQLQLSAEKSDWQSGDLTAEGLTANWQLNSTNHQTTALPQDVKINRILWKNWQLNDNLLKIALNLGHELLAANWQGKFQQGTFQLTAPVAFYLNNKNNERTVMNFDVQQIESNKFFAALNLHAINSTAHLSGKLQAVLQDDKLYFEDSRLGFKSPSGEILQIRPRDSRAIRIRDQQYSAFAMAVLDNMKCYQSQFDFSTAPGELTMRLKAEGVPGAPVPFVYQGRNSRSPFRPAMPGEPGFDGEIELNINLKLHPEEPGI